MSKVKTAPKNKEEYSDSDEEETLDDENVNIVESDKSDSDEEQDEKKKNDDDEEVKNIASLRDDNIIDITQDGNCYVKHARAKVDDDIEIDIEDDIEIDQKDKICRNFMTHYEYVRVLSVRSEQIARGAKPMIKHGFIDNIRFAKEIAKQEIINKVSPVIITRPIPNCASEKWSINELDISLIEFD